MAAADAGVVGGIAQRLRPILMTTGAMVLGAIPLALATGAGAESRRQIGWVIVGGMSLGTLRRFLSCPRSIRCWRASAMPERLKRNGAPRGKVALGCFAPGQNVWASRLAIKPCK